MAAIIDDKHGVSRRMDLRRLCAALLVKKELPGRRGDQAILGRVRSAGYRGPLVMGQDRKGVYVGE